MPPRKIVSREQWLDARVALLEKEKDLTRRRDALAELRRELPWVRVEKPYAFEGRTGRVTLADLFAGRSQLLVKHFMFGPGWGEGCVGCSFECDHLDAAAVHLEQHDVSVVAVSRAPYAEIEPFHRRMGWRFRWVSSYGSDFNADYHVSFPDGPDADGAVYYNYKRQPPYGEEMSGLSVFCRDADGGVFHTYSTYGRGAEELLGAYVVLDLTPDGRNETVNGNLTDWVRHHDRYDAGGHVAPSGRYVGLTVEMPACCQSRPGER